MGLIPIPGSWNQHFMLESESESEFNYIQWNQNWNRRRRNRPIIGTERKKVIQDIQISVENGTNYRKTITA